MKEAAAGKARLPTVESLAGGTISRLAAAESVDQESRRRV